MLFKRTLAATAIVLGTAFAANAADVPPVVVAPPPAPPAAPAPMAPAADWTGAYFGGWGAATFSGFGTFFSAGAVGGYDVQFGRVVVGANFRGSWTFGNPCCNIPLAAEAGARIGFLLGDRILVYGNGALGFSWLTGPYRTFGGGVEFAASDSLHLFAEVRRTQTGAPTTTSVVLGVTLR